MSSPRTAELAADPRVRRGMEAQLELRRRRLAGDEPLGWKVGFGTPQAFEMLGTSAPLVGFLTRSALAPSGAPYSIDGFTGPALEPEVAVRVGERGAAAALGPAFEIADVEPPVDDVEHILAVDIFQRGVVLGPMVDRTSLEGASARVEVNGDERQVADPEGLPGRIPDVLAHVAALLPEFGEELSPGDIVITGSIVPPLQVEPGDRVEYELAGFGAISIAFTS